MISPAITPRRVGRMQGTIDDLTMIVRELISHQVKAEPDGSEALDRLLAVKGHLSDAHTDLGIVQDLLRERGS